MNDIFKFRVWDTDIKEYLVGEFLVGGCGDMIHNVVDYESFLNKGNFVIEQCTGLKDKNGNLIYIGDKIKCGNGLFNTATVKYENGENFIDGIYPFNLYHDCGDECHCQLRDFPEYACEIIGNIHEQAEQKDK